MVAVNKAQYSGLRKVYKLSKSGNVPSESSKRFFTGFFLFTTMVNVVPRYSSFAPRNGLK